MLTHGSADTIFPVSIAAWRDRYISLHLDGHTKLTGRSPFHRMALGQTACTRRIGKMKSRKRVIWVVGGKLLWIAITMCTPDGSRRLNCTERNVSTSLEGAILLYVHAEETRIVISWRRINQFCLPDSHVTELRVVIINMGDVNGWRMKFMWESRLRTIFVEKLCWLRNNLRKHFLLAPTFDVCDLRERRSITSPSNAAPSANTCNWYQLLLLSVLF